MKGTTVSHYRVIEKVDGGGQTGRRSCLPHKEA
jgi:hypothetical protein